jgi:large subunit ribosomal protein L27
MAHKKGQGSVKNGRDSVSKRLGVKEFGGEIVTAGCIIIRQRGSKFIAGVNVGIGRDWTLYALKDGAVKFDQNGRRVNVVAATPAPAPAPAVVATS